MDADVGGDFASHLIARRHIVVEGGAHALASEPHDGQSALRKLWELTELSAHEFADEVARFYRLPRADLPQLLAGEALIRQFSSRFLREMTVFPYRSADGALRLAVAD